MIDVGSRSALAAQSSSAVVVYLTELGREGVFRWDGSNLSAKVSIDTQQAIYVAPTSTPPGASGAWVRQHDGAIDPRWAGALGDGVTNDSTTLRTLMLKAARLGLPIDGRGRSYAVTTGMSIVDVNFNDYEYELRNITLDASAWPNTGGRVLYMACTKPTLVGTLSADAAAGGTTFTTSSIAQPLANDDWVWIVSDKYYSADGSAKAGEILQISAVDTTTNTVTTYTPLSDDYTVADNAKVFKAQVNGRIVLDEVEIILPTDRSNVNAITVEYGFKNRIGNYTVRNCGHGFIDNCGVQTSVSGALRFYGIDPGPAGGGWGIAGYGSQFCHYGDIFSDRLYQTLLSGTGIEDVNHPLGPVVSRNPSAGTVRGVNAMASIVDQHPGGGFYTIANVFGSFVEDDFSSNPVLTLEGAGGSFGRVVARTNTCAGFSLSTRGYRQPNFEPTLEIGYLDIYAKTGRSFIIGNVTAGGGDLYPVGIPIHVRIGEIYAVSKDGASINCGGGDVLLSIGGGKMIATQSNVLSSDSSEYGRLILDMDGVELIGTYGFNHRPLSIGGTDYVVANPTAKWGSSVTLTNCRFDFQHAAGNAYNDTLVTYQNTVDQAGIANAVSGKTQHLIDMPMRLRTPVSYNTASGVTYTADDILGGIIVRDPNGADRTDTLPTATDFIAAIPKPYVGQVIECRIINGADAAEKITIAAGAGGSFNADQTAASRILPQNASKSALIRLTNVTSTPAYVIYA